MKKYISIILSILCILSLVGCNKGTETMYQLGIVVDGVFYEKSYQPMPAEVDESAIIGYIKSYSDTTPTKDGETNISKDLIDAPYAKVEGGIAILYENEWYLCTAEPEAPEEAEQWDLIPMVMVNGELYLDTGHEASSERKCGTMDGEITSAVDGSEKPTEDNQSNFGTGYGYQYGSHEGIIEIYINDKWWVFATEKVLASSQMMIDPVAPEETISFHDKIFNKSDLSQETIEWLEKYNNLSEEEQLSISSIPADLYELCGYPTAEDTEVPAE